MWPLNYDSRQFRSLTSTNIHQYAGAPNSLGVTFLLFLQTSAFPIFTHIDIKCVLLLVRNFVLQLQFIQMHKLLFSVCKYGTRRKNKAELLTFLNHLNESAGGLASERHFIVTFSRSARTIRRLGMGSSLAKCTDTRGASDVSKINWTKTKKGRL